MNMQNSDEWAENYQENISSMSEFNSFDELFDATAMAASPSTADTISSPKVSSLSCSEGSLFPKSSIGKPIRRRSRASRKTLTTLLNANASNFRALVQQFTGCHSSPPSFGAYKGPINLNFAQYSSCTKKSEAQQQQQRQQYRREDWINLHEESADQSLFSFCTNNIAAVTPTLTTSTTISSTPTDDHGHELFVSTVNYNPRPDPLTLEDFDMGENFSLQELSEPGDYSGLPGTRNDDFWGY